MPTYTPPNFNRLCNVWNAGQVPSLHPVSYTQLLQPYIYARTPSLLLHPASGRELPLIIVREPFAAGTHLATDYIVEISTFPTVYVKVQYVLRMHVGFPNQYNAAYSVPCNANGTIPKTPLPT